jgi:hypothetical protein
MQEEEMRTGYNGWDKKRERKRVGITARTWSWE